ncbi:unnamed protein product [Dovyalis caffra]|uniref:Uncharacterized protein n=1 Tax=Dovyalis caffra TaxID=77055 RepID=A0AAV1RMB2_9ROSI|nr:unnamed protein product [Dovyalis caffra]
MASGSKAWWMLSTALLISNWGKWACGSSPQVPCLFLFGDSLFDNGNNDVLATNVKANYLPYGIDFPHGSTGRCSNGFNLADAIARKEDLCAKYGDIIPEYTFQRSGLRTVYVNTLCEIIRGMCTTRVSDISEEKLSFWWRHLKTLQFIVKKNNEASVLRAYKHFIEKLDSSTYYSSLTLWEENEDVVNELKRRGEDRTEGIVIVHEKEIIKTKETYYTNYREDSNENPKVTLFSDRAYAWLSEEREEAVNSWISSLSKISGLPFYKTCWTNMEISE